MDVSSARPSNLNDFVKAVGPLDGELTDQQRRLFAAHQDFAADLRWGTFSAAGAIQALGEFVTANRRQAVQVATIGRLFEEAGGRGTIKRVPDSVIQTYLDAGGLGGPRRQVTYDDPVAYGFPPTSGYTNDPVNAATGNFVHAETDLQEGDLVLRRVYNSRSGETGGHGPGWSSWATTRLHARDDGAHYAGPDGQAAVLPRQGAGYGRIPGLDAAAVVTDAGLELRWFDGRTWTFDHGGRPVTAYAGPGTRIDLSYDGEGRLVRLAHQRGRTIDLTWSGPRVVAAELGAGRRIGYRYDEAGALVAAGDVRYDLDERRRVVSVVDADGVVEVVNTYDADGRVLGQATPFGRQVRIAYLPGGVTVVTDDEDGPANTFVHDPWGRLLTLVDGHGERLSRTYDEWGNPVSTVDRNGAVTTMEWDNQARLVAQVLPGGAAVRYRYDEVDRLTEVHAEPGAVTRYEYDRDERIPARVIDPVGGITRLEVRDGLVHRMTDPDGVTLTFSFDEYGDVVGATDGAGARTALQRDGAGRVRAAVSPVGRRTEFAYDGRGRITGVRTPVDATWRFDYTPAGRLGAVTDPLGGRQEFSYGPHGRLAATADPLGRVTGTRYDVFGNVVRRVAPDGTKWDFGYDALCRLISATDPSGATWLHEHDAEGALRATIDPAGVRRTRVTGPGGQVVSESDGLTATSFEYDVHGGLVTVTRADGSVLRAEYDACGRQTAVVDGTGGVTRFEYTAAGRLRRTTTPEGRATSYGYDDCGRLSTTTDGAGGRTTYHYDPDGLVTRVVGPDGGSATYRYDEGGRLVEAREPGHGSTRYAWDGAGRPVAIGDAATGTRRFRFDAAGRLVEAVDALGHTTTYAYDDGDRPVATTDPLGNVVTRTFDEMGRLVAITDPLGGTTVRTYDPAGRLAAATDASGRTQRLTRDAAGRVTAVRAGDGEPITVQRDALGRVVAIAEPGSFRHRLAWDAADRLTEHGRDGATLGWRWTADGGRAALVYPDGTETTYTYDGRGLVSGFAHPGLGEIELRRDAAGRVTGAEGPGVRAEWTFTDGWLTGYDFTAGCGRSTARLVRNEDGQIVRSTVDGGTRAYRYDAAGQLVGDGEHDLTYDAAGRLTSEGDRRYRYDAAGRLLAGGVTYDAAGRRVTDDERQYEWDDFGRLAAVVENGRRTAVAVDALGHLATVDGSALLWDTASVPAAPVAIDDTALVGWGTPWASVTGGVAQWLTPDWRGTPGGGRDVWGAPAAQGVRVGFRGEIEFAGLTWLRDRLYDPASRVFLSVDPLPAVPGTAWAGNPYHYAGNDPVGRLDPLGQRPVTDAELQRYRDQASRNPLERLAGGVRNRVGDALDDLRDVAGDVGGFVADNWEYGLAIGVTTAGVVLIATGGGSVLGAGLVSAGLNIAEQEARAGKVNAMEVAINGGVGMAAGPLGKVGLTGGRVAVEAGATRLGTAAVRRVVSKQGADIVSRAMAKAADTSLAAAVRVETSKTAQAVAKGFVSRTGGEAAKWLTGSEASPGNIVDPISVVADTTGPLVRNIIGPDTREPLKDIARNTVEKGVPKAVATVGKWVRGEIND